MIASGALAAGLARRRRQGPENFVLIHLDNCIEAIAGLVSPASNSAPSLSPPTPARRRRRWSISPAIAARSPRSRSRPYAEMVAPALQGPALDRRDFALMRALLPRARCAPPGPPPSKALFADSADRPSPPGGSFGSPASVQIHLRHGPSRPKARAVDACQRACGAARVNAAHQDLHAGRRAPDLPAAVPHQRAGLFDAGRASGSAEPA